LTTNAGIPHPGLTPYGWSDVLQQSFQSFADQGLSPARIIVQQRGHYRIVTDAGEGEAKISGRFAHEAAEGGYPVTGDWVAIAGPNSGLQVVAANIDTVFVAASLNADLNPRRLERYLAMAHESGAKPVIVLTKADACEDTAELMAEVEAIAVGVPVIAISARSGQGLDALARHMAPGQTAVLLGSSGVGKSTLVNALAGVEKMATQAVRSRGVQGRHTTTHRELVLLPSGALILDTPGMRELGLWDAEAGLEAAFADFTAEIAALAVDCKFSDCRHEEEPGCAVQLALDEGRLDPERWESYGKLRDEMAQAAAGKDDPRLRAQSRKVWVGRTKGQRALQKQQDRERED
jgi:ribosome biogenesis GTPase